MPLWKRDQVAGRNWRRFMHTEESLADEHARFRARHGLLRSILNLVVLTIMAAVVLVPFAYMVLISLKSQDELGNGRIIPLALRGIGSGRSTTWARASLTDEQNAALVSAPVLYVSLNPASEFIGRALPAPPPDSRIASVLARDKPRTGTDSRVAVLLETEDPDGSLREKGYGSLFLPEPVRGTWIAAQVAFHDRDASAVFSRATANYRRLLNWSTFEAAGVSIWQTLGRNLLRLGEWLGRGYPRWFLNSLFVALTTVALGLFFDSLAAFAFAKFQFPGRKALFALLLATIMIPYPVTLVPTFFIFAKLGLYNTYAALIIPGLVSAFGIFLVRQYLTTLPDDMIDAARVDGAGDFMVYRHVVIPSARPVLAALAVFRFIFQWNTYLYPLVLTNRDTMKTVQLGLATLEDAYGTVDYGMQMAGAALAVVPILIVYMAMQKHFIAGITMGSVKG